MTIAEKIVRMDHLQGEMYAIAYNPNLTSEEADAQWQIKKDEYDRLVTELYS